MVEKNFDSLLKHMDEKLNKKGYELKKEGRIAYFYNEKLKYKIEMEAESCRLKLCWQSNMGANALNEKWEKISSWLFDENISAKDIELICEDFVSTICEESIEKSEKRSKRKKNYSDKAADSLFFANRLVGVFPELRNDIYIEKESYSEFRGTVFTRENILPKIISLLSGEGKGERVEKLFKILSDLYKSSSLNIRSLITMGILNNITEHSQVDKAKRFISGDLEKAWACSIKFAKK